MVATRTEVDDLLDRALSHSTAEATEALYIGQDAALTRFANNRIHQNMREHDAQLQVRVIDRERIGVASTNRLDEAGIRGVVERAARSPSVRRRTRAPRSFPNPTAAATIRSSGSCPPRRRPAPSGAPRAPGPSSPRARGWASRRRARSRRR